MRNTKFAQIESFCENFILVDLSIPKISMPHDSEIEILCVTNGQISVRLGKDTHVLDKNQICISNSFDEHSYSAVDSHSKCILLVISNFFISKLNQKEIANSFASKIITEENIVRKFRIIIDLLNCLKKHSHGSTIPHSLYAEGLCATILGLILQNAQQENRLDRNTLFITNITHFVREHFTEKLTLQEVANHFGYSKHYFSKLFNKNFNCHFCDYVNHVRCESIIETLNSSPDQTVLTAVLGSGFSSTSAFYRFFKAHYKISPSKIKEIKNLNND